MNVQFFEYLLADLTITDETSLPLLELLTEKLGKTSHEAEQSGILLKSVMCNSP